MRHKGFILPLLFTFHTYSRHKEFQPLLRNPQFAARYTSSSILRDAQIQPFFDAYSKRNTPVKKRVNGKIALYLPLLKFTGPMFEAYLNPKDTILISHGMPLPGDKTASQHVVRLQPYIEAKDPVLPEVLAKADRLLARYANHPIFGHAFFREKLRLDITRTVGVINGLFRMFEEHPISAVVLGSTNEAAGRTLAVLAARRRIPSIATQHGMIGNEFGFLPVFAKKLAVHGYDEQQLYMSKGVSEKDIYITGHPRFDKAHTQIPLDRAAVMKGFGIDAKRKIVLLATNQIRDMQAWNTFIETLMTYPNVSVLIKPHRNEIFHDKLDEYRKLCKKYAHVKLLDSPALTMQNLLPNVDAVASELSTVGLEAMINGTPAVFLRKEDYGVINHRYYYEKMKPFVETDAARLARLTYAVVRNKSVRDSNLERTRSFMAHAYPVRIASEAISRVLGRLTGKVLRHPIARKYEGCLVKGSKPEIYYIRGGMKRHVVSRQAMLANGFQSSAVRRVPDGVLRMIPPGPLVK